MLNVRNWCPYLLIAAAIPWLQACEEPYIKHPLATSPDPLETGINSRQVARIQEQIGTDASSFEFAVISDTHGHHEELRSALEHIRSDTSISFILVCGDVTDKGNVNELQKYHEIMKANGLPFITVIGNREHYGTGRPTFEGMFGSRNVQFVAGGVRFILFDDVVTESNIPIDLNWLRTTLAAPHDGATIIATHIPPSDDTQLTPEHLEQLYRIIADHPPQHVFMGHTHKYDVGELPGGTPYTHVPWPKAGEYVKVKVNNNGITPRLVRLIGYKDSERI